LSAFVKLAQSAISAIPNSGDTDATGFASSSLTELRAAEFQSAANRWATQKPALLPRGHDRFPDKKPAK